jgi:hypothetical protein
MAQARERGGLGRFTMRTVALILGLVGTVIALILTLLYSLFHAIGAVAGVTADSGHFFVGIFFVLIGLGGSFLTLFLPILAALMLAAAGIGLFFAVGGWALFAAPFFFVAAIFTFSNRPVNIPTPQ